MFEHTNKHKTNEFLKKQVYDENENQLNSNHLIRNHNIQYRLNQDNFNDYKEESENLKSIKNMNI